MVIVAKETAYRKAGASEVLRVYIDVTSALCCTSMNNFHGDYIQGESRDLSTVTAVLTCVELVTTTVFVLGPCSGYVHIRKVNVAALRAQSFRDGCNMQQHVSAPGTPRDVKQSVLSRKH